MKSLRFCFLTLSIIQFTLLFAFPSYAGDSTPPTLIDFRTIEKSNGGDLTIGDITVKAEFIVSDESPLQQPKLVLKNTNTGQTTDFAQVSVISKSGRLTQFSAEAIIKQNQTSGEWKWVLFPLSDSLGNSDNKSGPDNKWQNFVEIYDKKYTKQTAMCQSSLSKINYRITWLNSIEKEYYESEEIQNKISLFRLKSKIPSNSIDVMECVNNLNETNLKIAVFQSDAVIAAFQDLQSEFTEYQTKIASLNAAKLASDKVSSIKKTKTITCIKGKITKKITGVNPKCPAGYKKK